MAEAAEAVEAVEVGAEAVEVGAVSTMVPPASLGGTGGRIYAMGGFEYRKRGISTLDRL